MFNKIVILSENIANIGRSFKDIQNIGERTSYYKFDFHKRSLNQRECKKGLWNSLHVVSLETNKYKKVRASKPDSFTRLRPTLHNTSFHPCHRTPFLKKVKIYTQILLPKQRHFIF